MIKMSEKVLITGLSGQDGYYLARDLLEKDYEVWGLVRRNTAGELSWGNIPPDMQERIHVVVGDVSSRRLFDELFDRERFSYVYHLAAQSHVGYSFEAAEYTWQVNYEGTKNIIDALIDHSRSTKMYNAATSELFGTPKSKPQYEEYPMYANSPYAIAKLAAYNYARIQRESGKLSIWNGITYNHESEIRGRDFLFPKVAYGIVSNNLELGNMDARKDWGYAPEYVKAFQMMLESGKSPTDYIVATNVQHSVRDVVKSFAEAYVRHYLKKDVSDALVYENVYDIMGRVRVNKKWFRQVEAENYQGSYVKIHEELGWEPKVSFDEMIKIIMENEIKKNKKRLEPLESSLLKR